MTVSEKEDLGVLAKKLGLRKKELLEQALTHPANKRMAWLGDAVLYSALTEHMYKTSIAPESELDPERRKLKSNPNLKRVAEQIRLNRHISCPPSERDPNAEEILAAAYEALIGAIFLDNRGNGYEMAASFVRKTLFSVPVQSTSQESSPT